jgi:hypothetical protein
VSDANRESESASCAKKSVRTEHAGRHSRLRTSWLKSGQAHIETNALLTVALLISAGLGW